MTDRPFNVPRWDGQRRDVADVWRLTKAGRHAECRLVTHPIGAEIRLEADGEFMRSEAKADPLALVDIAMMWKRQFEEKGWQG
jgi:hypothetical protein